MESNSSDSLVEHESQRASPQVETQLAQLLDDNQLGEQSLSDHLSHYTDQEEGARLDQLVLSYGLDRLVDDDTFLKFYLGLHALSSQTGLTVQFIDLHEVEGRARWLLGIVEFWGLIGVMTIMK